MPGDRSDRQWRLVRAAVLRASRVCYRCGHGGSNDVDHIVPPGRGGDKYDLANLAPIHGVHGCPQCGRKCNQTKGDKLLSELAPTLRTSRDWYGERGSRD